MVIDLTISDTLIQESIIRALKNVCAIMLKEEAVFREKSSDTAYEGFKERLHVFGSVGFVGDINGIVYLCIPDDFAQAMACKVLGITAAEIEMGEGADVKDVIGEFTNMTVGGFKNALCNIGFPCKLTLPTIVRGDNLAVTGMKSATRHIFHFDCSTHRLIVDIQLKPE